MAKTKKTEENKQEKKDKQTAFYFQIPDRYKDLEFTLTQISTLPDNTTLLDGSLAIEVLLDQVDNPLSYIDDGDLLILKGGAGTNTDAHVVKTKIRSGKYLFEKTSDLIQLEKTLYSAEELLESKIILGKILMTYKSRMSERIRISSNKPQYIAKEEK